MVISITNAKYIGDYKILLSFSDGAERTIDFEPFLSKSSNPMTQKYLDKKMFSRFHLEYGDLIWNDYEMCFPVWDLHQGQI